MQNENEEESYKYLEDTLKPFVNTLNNKVEALSNIFY